MMVLSWFRLSFLLGLLWVISFIHKYRKVLRTLQYKEGLRFFYRLQMTGMSWRKLLPPTPYVTLGRDWQVRFKHKLFSSRGGDDVVNFISCYPSIQPGYLVADPLAIQEIFSDRNRFQKYHEVYRNIKVFGVNIVTAEGDVWKRHRKAVAPSLSEKNNKMVWNESVKAMEGLIEKWGVGKDSVDIDHVPDITVELALRVIAGAGFGRFVSWDVDNHGVAAAVPSGHKHTFQYALHTFTKWLPLKIIAPEWMSYFIRVVRETHESYRDLQLYMEEMVDERRQMKSGASDFHSRPERDDLFNAILSSNEGTWDNPTDKFSNEEVFANMFIFLLAGHETVAHSLSFTLGLLAIHQDEQEKLYKHIIETLNGEKPSYDQMNSFSYVLATFYESMRLYPPIGIISKQATEDTTIPMLRSANGAIERLPVPKDSCLLLIVTALHYNPKYWPDPDKFDPSRFMGQWNRDAFVPFSGGLRGCVGRRFAEVEAVALLVVILKHYRIELKDPDGKEYAGLNDMEKREKLLKSRTRVTLQPIHEPLVFKKRNSE